jgi:hypothetical protein
MSKRAEAAWVVLGFTALAVASTYPLILHPARTLVGDLGDPLLTAWTLAWDADRLRHGLRGVWDAPNFFPYQHTLLYSDHLLGIAVFTAPIQWLTGNAVLAYNAAYLGSIVLAGGGQYLLARQLTGRRDAALIAGVIYASQPFRVSHLAHLQWLMIGWLPLCLWALHRYFRLPRTTTILACAACFVLQAATASYMAYFGLVPLVIVAIAEWLRTRLPVATVIRGAAPATVLVLAVMLPIVRGYIDVRAQQGLKRTGGDIVAMSADVGDYFSAPPALKLWSGLGSGRGEHELFLGAVAMGLALLALFVRGREYAVVTYAIVLLVAFLLSLGPEPAAWGHRLGIPGSYVLLLRVLPGLDGLRAVARLAVVVQVAVASLAAFGAAWFIDRMAIASRPKTIYVLVVLIAYEGWAAPMPTAPFPADPIGPEREAYAYLATLPAGGVLELPTGVEDFNAEFLYQFRTLSHRHRVVNGHSGYLTPLLQWLGGGHSPFREVDRQRDAITAVRGIGVRYLVVHRTAYPDHSVAEALEDVITNDGSQVIAQRRFGDITVAVLAPLDAPIPAATVPIAASAVEARASHSADRLPQLFDGDGDSRWISGHPQAGDEWIELSLDRPRDVHLIRLQMASRSFGDYPRLLEIDGVEAAGARTLFRGTVLPNFARAVFADGDYPWLELVLPANQSRSIRLRQTGTARTFFWSIHELQLRERAPSQPH